jgi:hypothetical protein
MIEWRFHLDDLEIEHPSNFDDIVMVIRRDLVSHGLAFEASLGGITFIGDAADYILEKERARGLMADIVFKAESRCDENDDWVEEVSGKLNLGDMTQNAGTSCQVTVPIERKSCVMLFRNRMDQKVDMDSDKAFDKTTALEAYAAMGAEIEIPGKRIATSTEGSVKVAGDPVIINDHFTVSGFEPWTWVRPSYEVVVNESIKTAQLIPQVYIASTGSLYDTVISPVVLAEDDAPDCFSGEVDYSVRMKGSCAFGGGVDWVRLRVVKGLLPDQAEPFRSLDGMTILHEYDLVTFGGGAPSFAGTFDRTFAGSTVMRLGEGFWAYLEVRQTVRGTVAGENVTFDNLTSVRISGTRECPASNAKAYMANESLSHAVEAVTNGCLKVKSDYYGRTDSQPYASAADGRGSLKAFMSGLNLRRAEEQKFFVSPKDLLEGLRAMDNIGYGFEDDPARDGYQVLRVEDVGYFYQDKEVLSCPYVPEVSIKTIEAEHYATIKVGYQKWESELERGLDEVNSLKEFRTGLSSVDNTLDLTCKLIAGAYPIEATRMQSFAKTGGADTKYDNDTFVLCVRRDLYSFEAETDNILGADGVYSPETTVNWRIRPLSNLMRWFRSVAASYPDLSSTDAKLFFTSGTGNISAKGHLDDASDAKLETASPKAENKDLEKGDFQRAEDFVPLWRPKLITYTYPFSKREYDKIKAEPYGYVSVQLGTGDWIKGYVTEIRHSPTRGEADINLKLKWE